MSDSPRPETESDLYEDGELIDPDKSLFDDPPNVIYRMTDTDRKRWNRSLVIVGVAGLLAGFAFGVNGARITQATPATQRVVVTVTTTVTPSPIVSTQVVQTIPESCQAALQYLSDLEKYVSQIIDVSPRAQELLQQAYVAIAEKNVTAINKAQTQLFNLDTDLSESELGYEDTLQAAQDSTNACLKLLNG